MRKIIAVLLLAVAAGCVFGCDGNGARDNSAHFSDESEEISEIDIAYYENKALKVYKFLKSDYTVTSTRNIHGIEYVYDYYFIDGEVGGVRQKVTLQDTESADEYYLQVVKNCPEAYIDGVTVIHFMSQGANCYGYSLDKLKFSLDNSGFEYSVNFNEEAFENEFYESSHGKPRTVS